MFISLWYCCSCGVNYIVLLWLLVVMNQDTRQRKKSQDLIIGVIDSPMQDGTIKVMVVH